MCTWCGCIVYIICMYTCLHIYIFSVSLANDVHPAGALNGTFSAVKGKWMFGVNGSTLKDSFSFHRSDGLLMKIKVSKLKLVLVRFEILGREDSGRIRLRRDSIFLLGRSKVSAVERDHRPEFTEVHFHFDSHSNNCISIGNFQVHGCEC